MSDTLKPTTTLLIKLGSIIVHQKALASAKGHYVDYEALQALLTDKEVVDWMLEMNKMALLPVKR